MGRSLILAVGSLLLLSQMTPVVGRVVFNAVDLKPPLEMRGLSVSIWRTADDEQHQKAHYFGAPNTFPTPAPVRPDGSFQLPDLQSDTYYLSVNGVPPGWWARSAMCAGKDLLDRALEIKTGVQLPEIVVTLTDRHTSVSGSAKDKEAGAFVVILPLDDTLWRQGSRRLRVGRLNSSKQFAFQDLPPGDYLLGILGQLNFQDLATAAFRKTIAETAKISRSTKESKR